MFCDGSNEPDIHQKASESSYESKLYYSSATKTSNGASYGGVVLILDQKAQSSLIEVSKVDDRIIMATFQGNPKVAIIAIYSPVEGAEDDEKTDFYKSLPAPL